MFPTSPLPITDDPLAVLASTASCCILTADCRDVLRQLPAGSIDAIVTDPPYGLGIAYDTYNDTETSWLSLLDNIIPLCRRVARFVVMPSCQIRRLPWWYTHQPPDWLIAWYKGSPGHNAKIGFNDWEPHVCWGRPIRPMHDFFHTRCGFTVEGHPCPKPVEWAIWLIQRAAEPAGIVLDPFMGSGTTGVAAKMLGRRYIGIDISPSYCSIARTRIVDAPTAVPPSLISDISRRKGHNNDPT
jgi:DNA modification methylase